jgi:hypothetical protein
MSVSRLQLSVSAGALGLVGLMSLRPSLAADVIAQATSTYKCMTSNSCLTTTNTKGPALTATSVSGNGIIGNSSSSNGIVGTSNSSTGNGVEGVATTGSGVAGFSTSGAGLFSQGNYGLLTFSSGTAIYADNTGSTGTAIIAVSNGGDLYTGTNAVTDQELLSIDDSGNEILAGTLTLSGQPVIRTTTSVGKSIVAYSARTSSPTLEDFGSAQLVNGQAYVPLESTFATTIDSRTRYMVFLSPQGDSRGLYVTQISGRGFAVRESNAGHSTLAFDYRIIAKPFDSNAARLAPTTAFSGLTQRLQVLRPR